MAAAGGVVGNFWDITMDEVVAAIRGWIERERYRRRATLVSGMFKKGTTETEIYSLPFDDELDEKMSSDDITDFYNNATKGGTDAK